MIALLLVAQLGVAPLAAEPARGPLLDLQVDGPKTFSARLVAPEPKSCPNAGRLEASTAQPTALYRKGDRPARMYLKWADYPEGRFCHLGGQP